MYSLISVYTQLLEIIYIYIQNGWIEE